MLSKENFPISSFSIVGLFVEDCNFNLTDCYYSRHRFFIVGFNKEEKCELMLRYGCHGNELVVARVMFIHKRQGKMTKLYQILKLIQREYKTGAIVIESVQTEEMKNWCIKNSFIQDSRSSINYRDL